MKYLILLIIGFVITLNSCKKTQECPREFELSGQVQPYAETYHIGDTITLISSFSKLIMSKNTNLFYNMEDIKWYPSLGVYKIDSGTIEDVHKTNEYIHLLNCSDSNYHWFTFSSGKTIINANYTLESDSFKLSFQILPKKIGIFKLEFGGGLMDSEQEFEGKCKNTPFDAYTILNTPKDNNIVLLKESPMEYYNDWLYNHHQDKFYKRGSFVFRVIE